MKRQGGSVELDNKLSGFSYCEKVLPLELAETLQPAQAAPPRNIHFTGPHPELPGSPYNLASTDLADLNTSAKERAFFELTDDVIGDGIALGFRKPFPQAANDLAGAHEGVANCVSKYCARRATPTKISTPRRRRRARQWVGVCSFSRVSTS